ncbi:uncharacterized protein LOC123564394 [Mercenaria mercenaria]|uniref:uncharacterized protein LOC123564394 n=1 Tax=Mercenaria mercenaria TaxID=6596 RepID=UPI00234EBDB4|nr:uncharacterized protein LOC123564394 [Mercenaria mercenaria]XP_053393011.1 uncharacterized protein LOC123564394 [Mercenaria mercenaria]
MSHNSTLENLDNVPVYQRYAVTLDDIKKSKAAKVPPKVKGHLANLLEAMDSYCDNPETYFANKANCEPPSSKKFESAVLNASVVSDLSNLSSPSENDFGIIDNCVEIVQRNVETVNNICNHICETAECQNKVLDSVTSGSDQPPRLSVNEMNGQTVTETEQSYKVKKNDIGELDEIKLMSGPVISAADCDSKEEDLEGFQKVVSKRKMSPRSVQSDDQSVWRIHGTNAIQVDGLPQNCELSELQSMVAGFGTVLDYQVLHVRGKDSVRFKLNSSDACQFAEQCLDDTDCLFPDYNCKLTCHQLQTGADE